MTPETGLTADFSLKLSASIDSMTAVMRADLKRKQDMAADVSYIETPALALTALPFVAGIGWGPNTGYSWAVQRMTVAGLGATTDYVIAYRGTSAAQATGNNALYTFQELVAGGTSTWHPGRTGCILKAEESLVFTGTFTGTQAFVSIDVIQLTDTQLPYFLL
jgi:hypothetical protein